MDFSNLEDAVYGDVENDEDLLAELYALEAQERRGTAVKQPKTVQQPTAPQRRPNAPPQKAQQDVLSPKALSQALADVESDGTVSDEDLDDPDLLAEFSNLVETDDNEASRHGVQPAAQTSATTVDSAMLQRLKGLYGNYEILKQKAEGDTAKIRRYQRALDKIQELTKKVQAGKAIDESEIPVALPVPGSSAAAPPQITPVLEPSSSKPEVPPRPQKPAEEDPTSRVTPQPKLSDTVAPSMPAATVPVTSANVPTTPPPVPSRSGAPAPQQSSTTEAATSGTSDVIKGDQIIRVLTQRRDAYLRNAQLANTANDKNAAFGYYSVVKQCDEAIALVKDGQVTECSEEDLPPLPPPYKPTTCEVPRPKTLLEGLKQRLEKFKSICEQNKADGESRKLRMNSRIVGHYEEAIRACAANRPYDYGDLPCPPGYPSLPLPPRAPVAPTSVAAPGASNVGEVPLVKPNKVHPGAPGPAAASGARLSPRQQQQVDFLVKRQLQFKQAALAAKQKNEIAAAKKYLVAAKGFDQLIEAARTGQPVDLKSLPVPPQVQSAASTLQPAIVPKAIESDFEMVEGSREDIFATLEKDLLRQLKLCEENRLAFTKLGDVQRVNFFESLMRDTKVDLLLLRQLAKNNAAVPRFRYESREFPSMDLHADLNEDHLELTLIRVVDAKLPSGWQPSDGNIFVKYVFSFPHNAHQSGKTKLVAGTNSPDFNEKVLLGISRKSKQLLRVVKRNCLRFEVYQKGGFLRNDKLLGVADCKLPVLEDKAHLHESVDLVEGRKAVGGKIEYKVRIREPLGDKKLSIVREKWLVLVKS